MKKKDTVISNNQGSSTWAWYGSELPASEDVISIAEAAEKDAGGPEILYDSSKDEGAFKEVIERIFELLNLLREQPEVLRAWDKLDGLSTFILTLIDRVPTDIRGYASILQRFGSFDFDAADSSEKKKEKIISVFTFEEETSIYSQIRDRAKLLGDIWEPRSDSLLHHIVSRPSWTGKIVGDRLKCLENGGFRIIGHSFKNVRSENLKGLSETRTVAYQRDSDIHLILDACSVLNKWDEASWNGNVKQATLLDTLLLHEIVEMILRENESEISPIDAHIVASTFERYLKGPLLTIAVEEFFLNWPKPLGVEVAELQEKEMNQQMLFWETAFEDHISARAMIIDTETDQIEKDIFPHKEKHSISNLENKIYRSKEGRLYRIESGKKVFVRKKDR